MTINTQYIQKVKPSDVKVPMFKFEDFEYKSTFDFKTEAPKDKFSTKTLWDDEIKALLMNSMKKMGISNYSPSIMKNDNVAIQKAQSHLIDMLKYFEGDKNYYYEAFTTPYQDKFGSWTHGFGVLGKKNVSQKQAYSDMCKKLEQVSKELKNVLNKRIGEGTYEALPNSIKEALIDLSYNKGLPKIYQNVALMQAIKGKDFSGVVKNSVYLYSGKSGAEKVEEPGLYLRSLNRMILATKDLKGKELEEARKEIVDVYNRAKACYTKKGQSTAALEKMYEQYAKGSISAPAVSAEAYKIKVDEKFKGKGLFTIAQALYKELDDKEVEFKDFYNKLKALNNDSDTVVIGQELKIPLMKGISNIKSKETQTASKKANLVQPEIKKEEEKIGFWGKVKNFFKSVVNGIKGLWNKIFGGEKEDEDACLTPFQKILKHGKYSKIGDVDVISYDYTIKKGDNLWNLSKTYNTSIGILKNDNNIEDENKVNIDQHINIQKLGYKVKKGDNLYQISKKFGISIDMLKDMNNIDDASQINADETLELPGFVYEAKTNENLEELAQQVGVDVENLKKINNLSSDKITKGQKLVIVYNNPDFGVDANQKTISVDKKTKKTTEIIDMSLEKSLKNRPLLQKKVIINGKVQAIRKVFNPTNSGKLSGKTIIVNAGHGYSQAGTDTGVVGRDGTDSEWLLNYDNAMKLKDQLCAQGAKVIFMQGKKRLIKEEVANAGKNKADMFISVHVNSGCDATKDRTQIYYRKQNISEIMQKKSLRLATIMEKKFDYWIPRHEKISSKDAFIDPTTKLQDYAQVSLNDERTNVLEAPMNKQGIPGVIWEVAFMSAAKGRERMKDPTTMKNYANLMTQAVIEYFN